MKRILGVLALAAFAPAVALAVPYSTTQGYGTAVLNTTGAAYIDIEGQKNTFSYSSTDITPVATATNVVTLVGSATTTLRVKKVCVEGTATAPATYDAYLIKRTTLDTTGTATQPSIAAHDSNQSPPSGVVNLYSANPGALGTGVQLRGGHLYLGQAATSPTSATGRCWQFGDTGEESLVLRGVNQSLAINHGGAAVPAGAAVYYTITWTESND
jgi:hypothetical protein